MLQLAACNGAGPASHAGNGLTPAEPEIMQLYNRSCINCHAGGGGGAPRTGDQSAWQQRLAKGMETLLEKTQSGYKRMPPMGMCRDCSQPQFPALIEYMAQSQ